MDWLPIQSIANAFHRNGIHTIAMDTYGLIAEGVAAAEGQVEWRIGPSRWWIRGKTAAGVANPVPEGRQTTAETPACAGLRTPVRRAIITLIAHLLSTEIAPDIPPPETRP